MLMAWLGFVVVGWVGRGCLGFKALGLRISADLGFKDPEGLLV